MADTHFFAKDLQGRFMMMDDGFVKMLRQTNKEAILGKNDFDFFPHHIAESYVADDKQVIKTGTPIRHRTEVVPKDDLTLDWHVSNKFPLCNKQGKTIGVAGITSKLTRSNLPPVFNSALYPVLDFISKHYGQKITVTQLAAVAKLSERSLERHFIKTFQTTPLSYLKHVRINAACHALLNTSLPIAQIAIECGFYDQSYMTSQFKKHLQITPRTYRLQHSRT